MKKLMAVFVLLAPVVASLAQGPAGKWKLISGYTKSYGGKTDAFLQDMYKEQPCLARIVYVFTINGKIEIEKNYCEAVDDDPTPAFGTTWKTTGKNKIVVTGDHADIDAIEFTMTFSGKEMLWSVAYPQQGKRQEDVATLHYGFIKQ